MTNTMLNEFVEKFLVHERDRKGSQDTTQTVEIYFNFVGRYIPPNFGEVALTAEEQEELRKKMEEKKAALRAEDMEKGVYILTGSLPYLEPQLAANSTRTATL